MKCRRSEALAALAVMLLAFGAQAGVRRFDMTTDAASNSEGEIELEGWLDFGRPDRSPTVATTTTGNGMAWLGARFGLLDSLELAGFLVLEKREGNEGGNPLDDSSGLMMWLSELRWRPVEVGKWPVDLFIQFQLMHWFEQNHPTQFRFTLGASRVVGRFLFAANVSVWTSTSFFKDGREIFWNWMDASGGASVNIVEADGTVPSVNLGLEAWYLADVFGVAVHNHLLMGGGVAVGPTLALARGRLWLTGHLGIPAYQPPSVASNGTVLLPLVGRIMLGINL